MNTGPIFADGVDRDVGEAMDHHLESFAHG